MTQTLQTKFAINDKVWHASTTMSRLQHPCPDCKGAKTWKAISPAGEEYAFSCPRCSTFFHSNNDMTLDYSAHVPYVSQLTIGSVRVDTADKNPVSYMCRETGVGSGAVYSEDTLFASQVDAELKASSLAAVGNSTVPWIVKQYDRALEMSDYQFSNAEVMAARNARSRHSTKLSRLFEDLRDAETIAETKEIIEAFSLSDEG